MTWPQRDHEHRPLRPGEDPVAEDLGNIEMVNSSGLQNTVAVMGLGALIAVPVAWALARFKQWRAAKHTRRT